MISLRKEASGLRVFLRSVLHRGDQRFKSSTARFMNRSGQVKNEATGSRFQLWREIVAVRVKSDDS